MIIKIIIVCIITAITYLAFPIIMLWINHGQFIKKRARLIALLNSIVVGIIYLILTTIIYGNGVWNAAPACIFYFINCAILTDKTKTTKNKTNLHRLTLLGIFTAIIWLKFIPLDRGVSIAFSSTTFVLWKLAYTPREYALWVVTLSPTL